MVTSSRRRFLQSVGNGMLIAGLGSQLAFDLGVASADDLRMNPVVDYGDLGPWITRMQEMNPDKLQVMMVESLLNGSVSLKQLTSAAALANAETFGGQDYVGYHAEMALVPALEMSAELPKPYQPLPVLKVLYRNTARIQQYGPGKKTLKPLETQKKIRDASVDHFGPELRDLVRQADMNRAEQLFAQTIEKDKGLAFNTLLYTIADEVDVHRFVLAYRGMSLIDIAGAEHSHTLLRQCVRHCVDFEQTRIDKGREASPIRQHLPKLMDEFKLAEKPIGTREPDDAWVDELAITIYKTNKFEASRAVAAALADGVSPKSICQAIALAANQLTLRQSGDPLRTHGASAGVHGSDAANAWRHMTQWSNKLNTQVGLLVSAWHTGTYAPFGTEPYPLENHFEKIKTTDTTELLGIAGEAIRGNDQPTASAAIHRYGEQGGDPKQVFAQMLKYAISEDGRLHSEKFYRTVSEEFALSRPAFRWRHLVALARVTASAYAFDVNDNHGHRAPGFEEACRLMKVDGIPT
ncbi:MAG: hypothetical protein ABL888_09915 [Pirellulaceae bacterium]